MEFTTPVLKARSETWFANHPDFHEDLFTLTLQATKTISALLARKPEGEAKLLSALVNKLGDPDRKLASKAGYLMAQLLLEHPGMKPVVVREVS